MTSTKRLIYLITSMMIFSLAACSAVHDQRSDPGRGQTPYPGGPAINPPPSGDQATSANPESVISNALTGTHWVLTSINASGTKTPIPANVTMTLNFDDKGQAGGSAGCNSFGSQYRVNGNQIIFSQTISTMMACVDPDVMQLEQRYLKALQSTNRFEQTNDNLTIYLDNGSDSLNFVSVSGIPTATAESGLVCSQISETTDPEWKQCISEAYGFEFQFPASGSLTEHTLNSLRIDLPIAPHTNLIEKYLEVAIRQNVTPCSSPMAEGYGPGEVTQKPVQVNGTEFVMENRVGVATGNIYTWEAYSTNQGDLCISLSFVLHSFDPQLVATPPPEYNQVSESAIFTQILSTFAWLTSGSNPVQSATPLATPSPQRIEFPVGGTSSTETGQLPASGSALYVLRAQAGQTLKVELSFNQGQAILAVWGQDGTVLMSDHAEAVRFEGDLPYTQDYYILLKGRPDGVTDFRMEVTIPPA